jgi:pimeloyl-ACP methyl ester carboxylesterase
VTNFGLVHGGLHGEWCWNRLIESLESLGHQAVAMDLPIDSNEAGLLDYAGAVASALDPAEEWVVVGHSQGGLVIPLVAGQRAVTQLVYLTALVPVPGEASVIADRDTAGSLEDVFPSLVLDDLGRMVISPDNAIEVFYHDCGKEVAEWASRRLRPQSPRIIQEASPLHKHPAVLTDYIVCTNDRALPPAWSEPMAAERLGVTPRTFDSGHSPFLSRPDELAGLLSSIVRAR